MSHDHATRLPTWVLVGILSIGAFTTTVNVLLLSPLLPLIADEFKVSETTAGQLGALTATAAALVGILVTPLIDRYPRRFVLQLESVILFGATVLSVVAPNFAVLAASRILAGLGGAIIFGVCLATATDVFSIPAQRNRAIGFISGAATLSTVIGLPLITQLGDRAGWRWAISILLPLTTLLFTGAFGLPARITASTDAVRRSWLDGYRLVWANRTTVALLSVVITLTATWFAWLFFFGSFAQIAIGVSAGLLSLLFLAGGAAELVANSAAPALILRFSARSLLLSTIAVLGLCLLGVGIVFNDPWTLFPFMVIASLATVLISLFVSILLLDSMPMARGAVMALQSASFEVGGAIGMSGMALALILMGSYPAAYRLIGIVTLVLMAPLALYACRSRGMITDPQPASAPSV